MRGEQSRTSISILAAWARSSDDGEPYPFHCVSIADGTRNIEVGGASVQFDVLLKLGRSEAGHIGGPA